jgi:hypothetical protein
MSDSKAAANLKLCDQIMHSTLKLALEIEAPEKVVDFTKITKIEDSKCTGYLMLFFTNDSVTGETGCVSLAAGCLPPKTMVMLWRFYPKVFENLFGGRY